MTVQYSVDFLSAVDKTLGWEGGYVNDAVDRGGATRHGITEGTLKRYNNITGLDWTLEGLDHFDVLEIYYLLYWRMGHVFEMPDWSQDIMFDWSVHSGPHRATTLMQLEVGANDDGLLGPLTIGAMVEQEAHHGADKMVRRLAIRRMSHLCAIVQRDPTQSRFIKGWWRRVSSFIL